MIDVAIIGGGISGLTAAYQLKRQGHQVVVLERQVRPGGNAISENLNGFLMEHGPSTVNATVPEVEELSRTLGLNSFVLPLSEQVKHRYLVKGGELAGIPVHPMGFLSSDYLSLKGRLRLLAETLIPKGDHSSDESVDQYITRRFGAEFSNRIMDPLVGGLYAGHSDELSVQSVFPKLIEMEQKYGSLSMAVLMSRLKGRRMPAKRLYSWSQGIGSLPNALSASLGGCIKTGAAVQKIKPGSTGYQVETTGQGVIQARAVLVATQPHVTATMLEYVAPGAAETLNDISAPPLAVIFMGYKRRAIDHPLDGLGYLSPKCENQSLTGAQFPSTMFAGRAPEGYVSLTGYFGGSRYSDITKLNENDLLNIAQEEFKDLLGARGPCEISKVRFWSRGIPQYKIGHQDRVRKIQNANSESPGIFVTGNYLSGPSVGACVANAQQAADHISKYLESSAGAATIISTSTPASAKA